MNEMGIPAGKNPRSIALGNGRHGIAKAGTLVKFRGLHDFSGRTRTVQSNLIDQHGAGFVKVLGIDFSKRRVLFSNEKGLIVSVHAKRLVAEI